MFEHKTACLRHGYWLHGRGRGQRLNLVALPEAAAAQRRLERIACRCGPSAAMPAFELGSVKLMRVPTALIYSVDPGDIRVASFANPSPGSASST